MIFNFNEVFAQSEGKNKNFKDGATIHSSETSAKIKTKVNNSQEKFLEETILFHSSETSTTIGNKNKDKTPFIGRPPASESAKIHPAITQILEHANPKALAKIMMPQ